jgi:MFS family permease
MPDPQPDSSRPVTFEPQDPERPASAAPTERQLENESPLGHSRSGHDPYAALRLRDYRVYAFGWVISVMGRQIQEVAVTYEIYERTNSKLALAWIAGAQLIPQLLLTLPGGHLADRTDRRRIIMGTQALWAVSALGLAILSHYHGPVSLVYLMLALSAAAHSLGWPARSSMLPEIVPPDVFNNAVTWNSSLFHVAAVVGPAVGGFILLKGTTAAYVIDLGCALVFLATMAALPGRGGARPKEPPTLESLAAGIRFVWRTKIILATITLDLFAVVFGGSVYLLPVFRKDVLHVGEMQLGWLRAAPAVGGIVAAMLIAHRPPMKRAGRAMLWAVVGFGVATIGFGLSRWFWLSFVMLALTGAFDNISVVVRHTLIQALPPESMRGRVAAVNGVFIGASNYLGGVESGLTAAWWGPVRAVVAGGIGTLLVVAGVAAKWPQVRRFGSLRDARPMPEGAPCGVGAAPASTV